MPLRDQISNFTPGFSDQPSQKSFSSKLILVKFIENNNPRMGSKTSFAQEEFEQKLIAVLS